MNLIVDIGNTSTKVAGFENDEMIWQKTYKSLTNLKNDLDKMIITNAIISSVAREELTNFVKNVVPKSIILNHLLPIPIKNLYKTPKTLGNDRLANAVAGYRLFNDSNTLIIDAGTCLKFDFINKNNEYLGGAIAPGLRMRFNALHTLTANLPLIENFDEVELIGNDTNSSMISGCYNGIINEIEATIVHYTNMYNDLNVILTGGDVSRIEKMDFSQKNSIFADRWLTLKGLNEILKYNAEK
jgi:type III pantothenate kinase